jgi:hypothetical protein
MEGKKMKLPKIAHTSRRWRVHEITKDFELEDVWRLPTPGSPDDLARLVEWFTTPARIRFFSAPYSRFAGSSGRCLAGTNPGSGVDERVPSLRKRLPADLLEAPRGSDLRAVPGREAADGPRFSGWSTRRTTSG